MAARGQYTAALIPVTGDVCSIVERLQVMDEGYFMMFNRVSGKYEVHHEGQAGDTLACSLPFDQLDERTLERVRETRTERADELFRQLMKEDERLMEL